MFRGFSSLGAVGLELISANNSGDLRRTHHTLDQAFERVIWRQETLSAEGRGVSYVWWHFEFDQGELSIHYDGGLLKQVRLGPNSFRYVALADDFDSEKLIEEWMPEWDVDRYRLGVSPIEVAMLTMGVQPYQRCLSAYSAYWSQDYYGESDCDIDCRLLYVEPFRGSMVYLPMRLDFDHTPNPTKTISYV